jgi:alanyl-tRNA synthetase
MGLERIATVMQNKDNVYETDLFAPIIAKIKQLSVASNQSSVVSMRIIADHLKAATFIITDGIEPSNVGRGYVLRRLIRRAVRHGKLLGIENNFVEEIAKVVIEVYKDIYSELEKNKDRIFEELENEEKKFKKTLEKGLKELGKLCHIGEVQKIEHSREIKTFNRVDAKKAFYIFQTYGFPLEMIQEELARRGLLVDESEFCEFNEEFNKEMKKHQELSRTASAGMFKGGLADAGEQTAKYHTATHLLHQALRDVLGNHVIQKGSNLTAERLRFDFSHSQKVTPEQIRQVEDIVNEKIQENLPVIFREMSLGDAKKTGALGAFEQKYGERVKVYSIGSGQIFSAEICGGPHAERTGELGKFKILKEEASSAGVRRIKAVLE